MSLEKNVFTLNYRINFLPRSQVIFSLGSSVSKKMRQNENIKCERSHGLDGKALL
jgi:hypothetical protein